MAILRWNLWRLERSEKLLSPVCSRAFEIIRRIFRVHHFAPRAICLRTRTNGGRGLTSSGQQVWLAAGPENHIRRRYLSCQFGPDASRHILRSGESRMGLL